MALYTPFVEKSVNTIASGMQQKQQTDLAQSAYMGDPNALGQLYGINPELAEKIKRQKQQDQQNQLAQQAQKQKVSMQADEKTQKIARQIAGDVAKMPFEQAQPYAAQQAAQYGVELPPLTKDFHDQMVMAHGKAKGEKGNNIGQLSPKDFTVESLAKYAQTGNIGDAVRYSPKIQDIAGIPHQVNPLTQKWEPIVDLTDPSITEQAKVLAKIEADNQSEKDFAKSKLKWQENENKILSSISMADSKTEILNNTTDKLKSLLGALSTRYGSFLSKFPATDARTIKGLIQTIKANSAFTTLTDLKAAGGTLGAISEAELGLLSSALGSIDQSGDTTELIRVLDQISKANDDSVTRIKSGYDREKSRYSTGFQSDEEPKQSAPQQAPADTGILDQARAAIAGGADRQAVINRLKENGIDAGGL